MACFFITDKIFFYYLRRVLEVKDYYSILELAPSATGDDIKKAYRRLAHIYHPDKMGHDLYASAKFSEIKEAYETLINPAKKDYYLQQRWFAKSKGQQIGSDSVNPVTMLKKMLELDRYVSKLDVHRIHHESMYHHLSDLLSNVNIQTINSFGETHINAEIVRSVLKTAHVFPFRYVNSITEQLKKFVVNDETINLEIDRFILYHKRLHFWEKKKIWLIILIVLLICIAILLSTK